MHKHSFFKMNWFKNKYLSNSDKLKVLDVGSFDSTNQLNFKSIFDDSNFEYIGLDVVSGNNVDIVVSDIYNWYEIPDNSYDVIISGQFFAHLEYFWLTMGQIERVLKPGGHVCIIVPSAGHKFNKNRLNCYRFHDDGLRALAKYVGLNVDHVSTDYRPEAMPWFDSCLVAHK